MALIAVLSVLCLAAAGGYWFLYSGLSETNARSASLLGEIRAEEKRAEEARLLGDLVEETQAERAAIDAKFVGKEDIVPFIERIEATAKAAGIKADVASVDLAPVEGSASKEAVVLRLSASGSWRDTMHFAALLESLPYAINVKAVSLSASGLPPADAKSSAPRARQWVSQFDFTALKQK
jgi:hypothetical protein